MLERVAQRLLRRFGLFPQTPSSLAGCGAAHGGLRLGDALLRALCLLARARTLGLARRTLCVELREQGLALRDSRCEGERVPLELRSLACLLVPQLPVRVRALRFELPRHERRPAALREGDARVRLFDPEKLRAELRVTLREGRERARELVGRGMGLLAPRRLLIEQDLRRVPPVARCLELSALLPGRRPVASPLGLGALEDPLPRAAPGDLRDLRGEGVAQPSAGLVVQVRVRRHACASLLHP